MPGRLMLVAAVLDVIGVVVMAAMGWVLWVGSSVGCWHLTYSFSPSSLSLSCSSCRGLIDPGWHSYSRVGALGDIFSSCLLYHPVIS